MVIWVFHINQNKVFIIVVYFFLLLPDQPSQMLEPTISQALGIHTIGIVPTQVPYYVMAFPANLKANNLC